jgi:ketosteroid isomerase-like protein
MTQENIEAGTDPATSEQNAAIVREVLEAWNRRDFETLMGFAADDSELHLIGGFAEMIGDSFKGPEAVLRFWSEMAETIGGRIEFGEARALGDGNRLLVRHTWIGRGFGSGATAEMETGQIWTFRDGKVLRVDAYYDPAAALEAAGLSE